MRVVVTGSNRGIGEEFVRQLIARGDTVDAAVRDPARAEGLHALAEQAKGALRILACDVASDDSVRRFGAALEPAAVDLLINNAGILGEMKPLVELDPEDMVKTYRVDAIGPVLVTRAVLPLLRKGKTRKIAHVTSRMGSISDNTSGGAYGYRMAKAALNMASRTLAIDLRGEGFTSVVLNPGWVKTDMGGHGAPTTADE